VTTSTDNGHEAISTVIARFDWQYAGDPRLSRLYEKAKASQWDATDAIDWNQHVDFGSTLPASPGESRYPFQRGRPHAWDHFRWEFQAWLVSQFLHGEQGALVATARLVETLPDMASKIYAASQVIDEARHVEAFSRYLDKCLGHQYAVDGGLSALLENVMTETRWDITFLGMQIIVEGIAVASFRLGGAIFHDPVISRITHLVARDEARHVSFGMIALENQYKTLTSQERADREEFVLEAAALVARRFRLDDIWIHLEIDPTKGAHYASTDPLMIQFRKVVFAMVVTSLSRLGLLTPRVRTGLQLLGLL
jgi:Long-chain fatty aldehyde decarbonylase